MVRFFLGAMLVLSLSSCVEHAGQPVGTTRLTASRTWDGAHAELFSAHTKSARVEGEILWPAQVHGGPPPLAILAPAASRLDTTALALRLAGNGVATLRYSSRGPIDAEVVSASVDALRRDPRVGRIMLVAGATSSEVIDALSRHVHE